MFVGGHVSGLRTGETEGQRNSSENTRGYFGKYSRPRSRDASRILTQDVSLMCMWSTRGRELLRAPHVDQVGISLRVSSGNVFGARDLSCYSQVLKDTSDKPARRLVRF